MKKRDARSLDHGTLEEMRRLAVRQRREGATFAVIAKGLDVHSRTVMKWVAAHDGGGDEALASRKAGGRPPTLGPKQQARLYKLLIEKTPEQLKFDFALWTLPLVARLIEREFGVVLHVTTVSRILHRLGLTPQKPVRRAFQRDDAACDRWARDEFPNVVRLSKRRQSTLLFEDESGVHEDGPIARTWGLKGKRPVVKVSGTRRRTNVISAISPRGRLWFRCYDGTLTALKFIEFLRALLQDVRGEIDLVLDRHPAHQAAVTQRFINGSPRLRVHWLPGYAPDMNPDEHVWSHLKRKFRREPVAPDENLIDAVRVNMEAIREDRSLVKNFFKHPDVAYVREALKWK